MTLEKLLNMLCTKGWKPFGMGKKRKVFARGDKTVSFFYQDDEGIEFYTYLIRDVVSKESGLWQFCMGKGFTPNVSCYRWEKWFYDIDDQTQCEADVSGFDNYGFRLIESALKDESELESFILDNIKL